MRILDYWGGRWLAVLLTTALGLVTMRTQADFALGALVTLAAGWGLVALDDLIHAPRPGCRAGAVAFLTVTTSMLVDGFGPWSDRVSRTGTVLLSDLDITSIRSPIAPLNPLTITLIRTQDWVQPDRRVRITTMGGDGAFHSDILFRTKSSLPREALARRFNSAWTPFRFLHINAHRTTLWTLDVYLDAAYIALAGGASASLAIPALLSTSTVTDSS